MAACSNCDKKTCIKIGNDKLLIAIGHIVYCEKDGLFTKIVMNDGKEYSPYGVLKNYRKKMRCCNFVLINSSRLINFSYFEGYQYKNREWFVQLEQGIELKCSGEGLKRINKEVEKLKVISCIEK
jgi:DNA-binding LytR/AlgR family response regulator